MANGIWRLTVLLGLVMIMQGCALWGIFPMFNFGTIRIAPTIPLLNRMEFQQGSCGYVKNGTREEAIPARPGNQKTVKEYLDELGQK